MLLSHASGPDKRQLTRYLLGDSGEEIERIEELTIADSEVAWRMRDVENDLVDAYVRGTLDADARTRFESFYVSSPRRRAKVGFARAFLPAVDSASVPEPAAIAPRWSWSDRLRPRSWLIWNLTAATTAALLVSSVLVSLVSRNVRPQRQAPMEARQQLREQDPARRAQPERPEQPPGKHTSSARKPKTVEIILSPQTRGIGSIPTVRMPPGTDRIALTLRIESNDAPAYQVVLKDPANDRIVWRSGRLAARSTGRPTVSVFVPARLLKPQGYSLVLTARGGKGPVEMIGSYAFRIAQP
jgi:anti-sigma factor RsiW